MTSDRNRYLIEAPELDVICIFYVSKGYVKGYIYVCVCVYIRHVLHDFSA